MDLLFIGSFSVFLFQLIFMGSRIFVERRSKCLAAWSLMFLKLTLLNLLYNK